MALLALLAVAKAGASSVAEQPSWGSVFERYTSSGTVMAKDAYTSYTEQQGSNFLASLDAQLMDRQRWESIVQTIYDNWNQTLVVKHRVVAVMSTTPRRISKMQPAIDSVLAQTHRPDMLYLFVPYVFFRDGTPYVIPSWLQDYHDTGKMKLVRCEDLGPGTALYAVLPLETEPDTYIFKVDDDQFYGPNSVNVLLRAARVLPDRALSLATTQIYSHTDGVILQSVHGNLLQRKFIDETIYNYAAAGDLAMFCYLNDDMWISMHLAKKGIRRETLQMRQGSRVLETAYSNDALYRGGAGSDNYMNFYLCNAGVLRNYPTVWGPLVRVAVVVHRLHPQDLEQVLDAVLKQELRPNHVYICGHTGSSFYFGEWLRGFSISQLQSCAVDADLPEVLHAALGTEDDPLTVLVATNPALLMIPTMLRRVVTCVMSVPLTAPRTGGLCNYGMQAGRLPGGSIGSWRGLLNTEKILTQVVEPLMPIRRPPDMPPVSMDFWNPSSTQQLPAAIATFTPGPQSTPIVVVMRVRQSDVEHVAASVRSILSGEVPPDRLFLAVEESLHVHVASLDDPRVTLLQLPDRPLADVAAAARLSGPKAAIVRAPFLLYRPQFLRILLGAETHWAGAIVGVDAVRYGGLLHVFKGPALFPPGTVDAAHFEDFPEALAKCAGAEALWLRAHAGSLGVPAVGMAAELLVQELQPVPSRAAAEPDAEEVFAWERCHAHFWPIFGHRLVIHQPRILLFISFPPLEQIQRIVPGALAPVAQELSEYDMRLLEAQAVQPSAVYHFVPGAGRIEAEASALARGLAGAGGFEVRALTCGQCSYPDKMRAAFAVEKYPDALLIFASVERLINDQLVGDNLRCAQQILWVPGKPITGVCGYPVESGRIVEFAMLRAYTSVGNVDF
ncbi:unnamed protein product [Polarella glacialis]|uniref:Hexosyltransferase n=1 Tax=Polarella glacialis TaxID=89957 RepID=A0A813GFM5_POLGL|nr:unnamed protein product [Polarella glacialis]